MTRVRSGQAAQTYRWMVTSGFFAIVAFTVVAGFYLPAHREAARLRRERQALEAEHAASSAALERMQGELAKSQAENAQLRQAIDSPKSADAEVRTRIEKLERLLSAQFGRLVQAKMMLVSSASDRVSVALAVAALFSARDRMTPNGRELLCQLSKAIISEFDGQIRVTGYYGKDRLEPSARRGTPWHLAAARAASAAEALEHDCNVPADRFLVVSYGPRAAGPLGENLALEFIFRREDVASEL